MRALEGAATLHGGVLTAGRAEIELRVGRMNDPFCPPGRFLVGVVSSGEGSGAARGPLFALSPLPSWGAEEVSPHAHNNYLQILVEMGLPGIVALVWLQVAVISYLVRRAASPEYEDPERMLLGAILMGFVTFVVNGFFHYDWGDALPSSFMWILVGLACAVGEKLALRPSPKSDEPPSAVSTVPA